MKNLWKYASLNQRERANMIKNGNVDVYNTEKAKNKLVRDANKALGISTDKIDAWDDYIDRLNTSSSRKGLPKFMSTRESDITNEYNRQAKQMKNDYEKESENAVFDATSSSEYLSELLTNKGYSKNGSTYKKANKKIEEDLEYELEALANEFSEKIKSMRARYLNML